MTADQQRAQWLTVDEGWGRRAHGQARPAGCVGFTTKVPRRCGAGTRPEPAYVEHVDPAVRAAWLTFFG